jgi:Fe-S cluster assembly iron-binding protein IscA/pimeloyl-ACP methyl ester carboxylesterase
MRRCVALVCVLSLITPLLADPPAEPKAAAPKKAADRIVLTARAADQIRKFLKETPQVKYLRVSVDGERLKLDLDSETDPKKDVLGESRGVPVVVDRTSAATLPVGLVVDFVDNDGATGFKFASPGADQARPDTSVQLADARKGFKTTLRPQKKGDKSPAPEPPPDIFQVVRYDAAPGKLAAYLTPDPKDGKKHPAIIWITGGDCNSIDAGCWKEGGLFGEQSAAVYRKAGLVMMFPGLRGGNDNPGAKEGFLGEVDDVLAAAAFLQKQPYVDPDRIYLGGHSTGGTLALLTAECADTFRAVFSFGPMDDVLGYGLQFNPFVLTDPKELRLRSPGQWLHSMRSPVFVFEGAKDGNADSLRKMAGQAKNPKAHFFVVKGANHFNVLGPTNRLIVEKVLKDTGKDCNLAFTEEEVNKAFGK